MNVTYYGHSCIGVDTGEARLLFDPFITPNPLAGHIDIDKIAADYILVSHGHGDHIADLMTIAKRTGAKVIAMYELGQWVRRQGHDNVHEMNVGGGYRFPFGAVKLTPAVHSSSLPDGSYAGAPVGFVIQTPQHTFYFAGDTALHSDMQLISDAYKLDFAFLPIGDNFTMDVEDAVKAAHYISCEHIIGIHYNTFEWIKINEQQAREKFNLAGKTLHLMNIGESKTF